MSSCQHRQPRSEWASPFLCILAVAPITPMMGDDNNRAFALNLCILTGSARKVPRALFNHMLLHTFSPRWKQLGNVKEDCRKVTFFCTCLYGVVAYVLIYRPQRRRFWAMTSYHKSLITAVILLFSDHVT